MSPFTKYTIIVSPVGSVDAVITAKISRAVQRVFGFKTETITLLEDAQFAYNRPRNQYLSTEILEKLTERTPGHALKTLALCEFDLFIPVLTYVFGEAQLSGKSCLVSLLRLKNESGRYADQPGNYMNRAIKESIHELGHTFGLPHCPDQSCPMHYCRSIEDVDRKSDQFCRYCRVLLDDELQKIILGSREAS